MQKRRAARHAGIRRRQLGPVERQDLAQDLLRQCTKALAAVQKGTGLGSAERHRTWHCRKAQDLLQQCRSEGLLDMLAFVASNRDQLNGRDWDGNRLPAHAVSIVTDASDTGGGSFVMGPDWQMATRMPAALQAQGLSSAVKEVDCMADTLQELQRTRPQWIQRQPVQFHTDSLNAAQDCTRMKGAPGVFPAVRRLHLLTLQLQVKLQFVWHPRTAPAARLADELSKLTDAGDWALARTAAQQQIFNKVGIDTQTQVLDCMASAQARQCDMYFCESVGWAMP